VFNIKDEMKRSKAQIKQLSLLKAMRRYKALGFAYKMSPMINTLIKEGLSQRAIAEKLTLDKIQTASEWIPNKQGSPAHSKNVWTQTQVSRLIKDAEQVKHKMRWYYIKAHQADKKLLSESHPNFMESLSRSWKLGGHTRKTPIEHYQDKMNEFRCDQMEKVGEFYSSDTNIAEEYRRFTKRRSYHKAKLAYTKTLQN
jgi:hypothetical protein